jgi:hypothetical protein
VAPFIAIGSTVAYVKVWKVFVRKCAARAPTHRGNHAILRARVRPGGCS